MEWVPEEGRRTRDKEDMARQIKGRSA